MMPLRRSMFPIVFALVIAAAPVLGGCTALGVATGAGAAVGMAAASEGGISGAATDLRIKTEISERWFQYDVNIFSKLSMTVDQGRVLITGVVQNPDNRVEAVRLAWQVEGVKQVINEIRVAEGEGVQGFVNDTWITTRLRTSMTFDRDIRSINYTIDTVQGTVYIMGVARDQAELDRVIALAKNIKGVRQVVSYAKMLGEPVAGQPTGAAASAVNPASESSYPAAAQSSGSYAPPSSSYDDMTGSGGLSPAPVESAPLHN